MSVEIIVSRKKITAGLGDMMVERGEVNLYRWLAAAVMLAGPPAYAYDHVAVGEQAFFGELPVVLTVTRLPQSRAEVPSAVTVIDREMIEASGVVELTDLFRLVAGFQIGHYHDVDGPRVAVTYHGNTDQYSRRMQVLIDGRSVYTWGTGGAEWKDLPITIDDIERIEVSRGPNGVTYGSNAFLGVINIITYHPVDLSEDYARATTDDDRYREVVLRHAGKGTDFSYRLTGRYHSDNGFDGYTSPIGTLYELNDDSRTSSLTFRGDYRAGVNDYWTLRLGGAAGPREVGSSDDPLEPVRRRKHVNHYQQLQWKHNIDSDSEINVQLYHNLHKAEDKFETSGPTFPRDMSMESERYELELSHRFRLSETVRMVWGGALREDIVTAGDMFDLGEEYQLHLSRLYFNGEWKPAERWVVNLGDMVEQSNLADSLHSPRLAVNRMFGETGYMRVSAGRAYRLPTAFEEYANYTLRAEDGTMLHRLYSSPGNMQPERIDSMEWAVGAESTNMEVEAKLYREEIRDEIGTVKDRDPAVPQPYWTVMTVGESTVEGAELQLKVRTERSLLSLAYANTWAYGQRIREINPELIADVSDAVPRHTVNAMYSHRLAGGLTAGVNYYYVSPMKFYSGDFTDGVRSLDLNLSKSFEMSGRDATLRLLLKNLSGSYYDFEEETVSEKAVYLTLDMEI